MTSALQPRVRARALVVVGIVLLAFNMRPAAVSIGPVLAEIVAELQLSGVEAGLLTALPVLSFAAFGALTPRLAHHLGPHRLTVLALVTALLGMVGRSFAGQAWSFLLLSLLALAGMATVNVVMPSLVKRHFPDQVGLVTAVYTTAMATALTAASALTVPIAETAGSWRYGIASWAIFAVLAIGPWLALAAHDRPDAAPEPTAAVRLGQVARTRLGWAMAVFFGLQALQAYAVFGWFAKLYRDAGFSATDAGLLLGVITGIGIPVSFVVSTLSQRVRLQLPLTLGLSGCYLLGFLGLLVAPVAGAWLWAALIGIGTCTFPLILTLIGLRARTAAGTAALSGFTQSIGYLLSAAGPFAIGLLHDLTHGWTVPLIGLIGLLVPQLLAGVLACRSGPIEDQLPSGRLGTAVS
ncbi:MFS transporter [Micropruina sp.]|uniref:MFS transporter n=1 Tax=Micropruina sp. TaxID=2737536 RepID=UPI0039E53A41